MARPHCFLRRIALCAPWLAAALPLAAQGELRAPRTNAHGAPVLDARGAPINYDRATLARQAARAAPTPPDAGPAGTVRTSTGFAPSWGYAAFGAGIGLSDIVASDASGTPEIYSGGSGATFGGNSYWYALRHDASTGGYSQVYFSTTYTSGVQRLAVGDVHPNPGAEIVVARRDGVIELHDQASKAKIGEFATAAFSLNSMRLVDLGGDAKLELLLCNDNNVYAYTGGGDQLLAHNGTGGSDVIAGQMDADAGLEIATTDGRVLDYATGTVQWTWPAGFGFELAVADFDGDGMQELIASEAWSFCWAFDIDRGLPKWSISLFNVGAIDVADADGDGTDELIIGDAQWGSVHAYDMATQASLWSIRNPEHGTTDVTVFDVDGDGQAEVLWGAGATSTGEDRLFVGDAVSQQIEWENEQLEGPFTGPVVGDVDGDGNDDLIAVSWSSDAGYGAGRIVWLDPATRRLRATSQELANNLGWTGIHDVALHDVDGDGDEEIAIAAGTTYDALVEIYDVDAAGNFTEIWSNTVLPSGKTFYSVAIADVDGDGELEIVAGSGTEHTGSNGVFVYVYDYATGALEWNSLQMGSFWSKITDVEVADLDLDGDLEIIGIVDGSDAYVFDGTSKQLELIRRGYFRSIATHPNLPGVLLLGNSSGGIEVDLFVGGTPRTLGTVPAGSGQVRGLAAGPFGTLFAGVGNTYTALLLTALHLPLPITTNFGSVGGGTAFSLPVSAAGAGYAVLGFDW